MRIGWVYEVWATTTVKTPITFRRSYATKERAKQFAESLKQSGFVRIRIYNKWYYIKV